MEHERALLWIDQPRKAVEPAPAAGGGTVKGPPFNRPLDLRLAIAHLQAGQLPLGHLVEEDAAGVAALVAPGLRGVVHVVEVAGTERPLALVEVEEVVDHLTKRAGRGVQHGLDPVGQRIAQVLLHLLECVPLDADAAAVGVDLVRLKRAALLLLLVAGRVLPPHELLEAADG